MQRTCWAHVAPEVTGVHAEGVVEQCGVTGVVGLTQGPAVSIDVRSWG